MDPLREVESIWHRNGRAWVDDNHNSAWHHHDDAGIAMYYAAEDVKDLTGKEIDHKHAT